MSVAYKLDVPFDTDKLDAAATNAPDLLLELPASQPPAGAPIRAGRAPQDDVGNLATAEMERDAGPVLGEQVLELVVGHEREGAAVDVDAEAVKDAALPCGLCLVFLTCLVLCLGHLVFVSVLGALAPRLFVSCDQTRARGRRRRWPRRGLHGSGFPQHDGNALPGASAGLFGHQHAETGVKVAGSLVDRV